MFVPTTIVELGALMTDLEADPSVKVVESVRNAHSYRTSVEQRHVLPNLALPGAQARRAKIRTIGYGVRSDFELNFGRYLPGFGQADDGDTDTTTAKQEATCSNHKSSTEMNPNPDLKI